MNRQFPALRFVPFARRGDYDGVFGLVLNDPVFKRGQVIIVYDTARHGTEIEKTFPSLNAWAKVAAREIAEMAEQHRTGYTAP